MGKEFQSGDKKEVEGNALVWRTFANDSFKYLATRETMGAGVSGPVCFFRQNIT